LYSDIETVQTEQKERSQQNFIEYFDATVKKRHAHSSEAIRINRKPLFYLKINATKL